jgi:transposase
MVEGMRTGKEARPMAKPILDDALWELIEPLLPPPKKRRRRYPGRKPIPHRAALTGILYVLKSGIAWEMLPKEMGCGSGMSCWRRLHDWQAAGVWKKIHRMILNALQAADQIEWSRVVVDSSSVRALKGGSTRGRIRPIAANPARNTTSSSTRRVSRWSSRSRRPIVTM